MSFTKKKRLLVLLVWMAFLSAVYWGFGNTEYTVPITVSYFVLCLALSIAYLVVNGGIVPIIQEDRRREESVRKKYLADRAKEHPIKPKDKYRRFRIKKAEECKEEEPDRSPHPNPLKLPEEKQVLLSQIILVLGIPFYVIFFLDWLILNIF